MATETISGVSEHITLLTRASFHPLLRNNPRTPAEADMVAMHERRVGADKQINHEQYRNSTSV